MLHLARLDASNPEPLAEDVDLVELIDDIVRDAAFEAQARHIKVRWAPPAAPMTVRGNGAWLASAVENVVRNAVRSTAQGSEVEVVVSWLQDATRIEVRDHGPGVPAAQLARIFEPLHRVAESRTRDSGADGNGLAITARAVAADGGRVWAENADEARLRVSLSLPRAPACV